MGEQINEIGLFRALNVTLPESKLSYASKDLNSIRDKLSEEGNLVRKISYGWKDCTSKNYTL